MISNGPWNRTLKQEISRRRLLESLGIGAAGLAVGLGSGCGSTSGATPTAASTGAGTMVVPTPTQSTEQPVRGGTLLVAQSADITPGTTGNAAHGQNTKTYFLRGAIYNTLIRYRGDRLEAQPELAESWKFSDDFRSITVKLRQGVKFHNGRTMTSEDVKWNYQRATDANLVPQFSGIGKWVQKIETPDQNTVVMTFDQPRPSFLDLMELLSIAEPSTIQETIDGKNYVGTGPFKFKEWIPGDHYTVVRNPDYWVKDRPYLDEMTVKIIPDLAAQLINLQTGAVDVALDLDPRDVKSLQNDKKYNTWFDPVASAIWVLGIDVQTPPFTDKRVRQAMAYLLDRKRIIDTVLFFGEPNSLPWGKGAPAFDQAQTSRYEYNPTKAKELLTQAGVTNQTVSLTVSPALLPPSVAMGEILQAELVKLGWKVNIQPVDAVTFSTKIQRSEMAGMFFHFMSGFVHLTPSTLFLMALPFRVPNSERFDTPQYRSLIDQMFSETDPAKQKAVYDQMNETLLDECFLNPFISVSTYRVASAKVRDLQVGRTLTPLLANTWKSK